MSTTIKNVKIPYATEGVIRSAQLNDTIAPENSVQIAVNMNFDRIGAITTRPGITQYASQQGGAKIINYGVLSIQGTGLKRLFSQVGQTITMWDTANWIVQRGLSSTNKARFSQFLNYLWMVNGNASAGGDNVSTSNGSAFGIAMVPAGFPPGDYIQAGFEGRVWVADKSTDTIYYTDIVQFTPPSTYTLTFTLATNFIKNLSPQDGESITGLFRVPRALLVFKQNHIYRIYGAFSVDSYPAYNVGTYSQESIVQAKDGLYFHHSSGFYKFSYGSQPTEISRRVIDFVNAIPKANYENVSGIYDGRDAVEWSVGSVTVEGVTYSNCVMRYTISTQVWTIYDYKWTDQYVIANNITAMITFDDGTTINNIAGTLSGKTGALDTGLTDFGSPIYFEMIDRWRSFTEMYAKSKAISGINVYTENAGGTRLEYQTEKSPPNVWEYIDTINENFDALFPNASTNDFAGIRLRLSGNTTGTPIIFDGIEILSIQDKGFDSN